MVDAIVWFTIVVATTALAGFVAARAWEYRPARLFVLVCALLLALRLFNEITARAPDAGAAFWSVALTTIAVALLAPAVLALFAALFVPEWFAGRRPIIWICLPYLLAALVIAADLALGGGVFFAGLRPAGEGWTLQRTEGPGLALLALFAGSWLVHLGLLGLAFARQPAARPPIGVLVATVLASSLLALFDVVDGLQAIPITLALGYVVLRTRLLLPTRVGIEQAVLAMGDLVLVLDAAGRVAFTNPAAAHLGLAAGAPLDPRLAGLLAPGAPEEQAGDLGGRRVQFRRTPLRDRQGHPIGLLLLGRDLTDLERQSRQLAEERSRLAALVEQLRAEQRGREELASVVRGLEMPVIPALPGVVIIPLVGALEGGRISAFLDRLLRSIERERARLVLLDITGIPLLDTQGVQALLSGVRSARLLGARCVLVGVRPEIAQSLVALGVGIDEVETAATLQQALQRELAVASER